jgi:hypothetical protein
MNLFPSSERASHTGHGLQLTASASESEQPEPHQLDTNQQRVSIAFGHRETFPHAAPEQTTADPIARAPACPHAVKRQATP